MIVTYYTSRLSFHSLINQARIPYLKAEAANVSLADILAVSIHGQPASLSKSVDMEIPKELLGKFSFCL